MRTGSIYIKLCPSDDTCQCNYKYISKKVYSIIQTVFSHRVTLSKPSKLILTRCKHKKADKFVL